MSAIDTVSIGSAMLDVVLRSDAFVPTPIGDELMLCEIYGSKADVSDALLTSGGAGTNTAVSFARQGLRAAVIAEVGYDLPAQVIMDELSVEGVESRFIVQERDERTAISALLVAKDGSRSALTFRGAAKMLTPKDIDFSLLKTVRHVHLSSIGNTDLIRELFLFCRDHQISLSWNPSKAEVEEIVLTTGKLFKEVCSAIFVNDQEYAVVESKSAWLQAMTKILIVTRGKHGGEIWLQGEKQAYTTKPVTALDETGAGDAFASGFMGSILRKKSTQEALDFGVANATSVVQHMGAKRGLLKV